MKVKFFVICGNGDNTRLLNLPGRYVVCPCCEGEGTHVNRAIDENGISPEEFAQDPDFAKSYHSGVYDVTCEECDGARVVGELDMSALPKTLAKRVQFTIDGNEYHRRRSNGGEY